VVVSKVRRGHDIVFYIFIRLFRAATRTARDTRRDFIAENENADPAGRTGRAGQRTIIASEESHEKCAVAYRFSRFRSNDRQNVREPFDIVRAASNEIERSSLLIMKKIITSNFTFNVSTWIYFVKVRSEICILLISYINKLPFNLNYKISVNI